MALKITKDNFDEVIMKSELPVLVDFWASWCGPCKMLGPTIEMLSDELAGKAVVGKVNVDEEPSLAQQFRIMSIPTVVAFKNGQVIDKSVGVVSKEKLLELLGI